MTRSYSRIRCFTSPLERVGAAFFIGGGQNTVLASGQYASIFGGENNHASGSYSAILGGSGNSDGGLGNVFIAGTGIVVSATVGNADSLHVNNLWFNPSAILTYAGFPAPFNSGTVYVDSSTNNTLRMNP
jgi:hypothetical protein